MKNELIEEEGWQGLETVCCVVLLLVAVAIVESFYVEMGKKEQENKSKITRTNEKCVMSVRQN